ncbi:MAG: phosphoglucomutase, partial [Staphylococcus sp.]|nr:phosphoglucomutase [Staphylococcus sp.]
PLVIKYASILKNEGKTLHDALTDIYEEVGYYRDQPTSKIFEGKKGQQEIATLMEHLRQHIPDTLGGLKVIAVEDYQSQERINKDDGTTESIALPKSNVIRLIFDEGFVALRPSGTEPKLKFYLSLNVDDFEQVSHDIYQYIFNDNK